MRQLKKSNHRQQDFRYQEFLGALLSWEQAVRTECDSEAKKEVLLARAGHLAAKVFIGDNGLLDREMVGRFQQKTGRLIRLKPEDEKGYRQPVVITPIGEVEFM